MQERLNSLDPAKSWSWDPDDRIFDKKTQKWQLPMWHQYQIELFPHWNSSPSGPGPTAGLDEYGNELPFPSFFRRSRDGSRKGIIKVIKD